MMSCCCHLSQSINLNGLKSTVGNIAEYEKKLGQGIQTANNYLASNNLPKLRKRQLQSKSMQGVQSYGQQHQPMQQQQQQPQQQQSQPQQQNSQQQQPQQQQSQQQQQQPQQQQYYSSNMMMKRQMGESINHNAQQPMSSCSQSSNSNRGPGGYGQPIGQSQMMKRQQQSKLAQAFYPSQQGQQQQQQLHQYGYPPSESHMQMGGMNMQPELFPHFQQPQQYDNIGFDENQQDIYEPVDGSNEFDDDDDEEPIMGGVMKRELM
ncbi:unnamed protein product [Schistosoma margrebowiei]|uniref:Uncharacterized protein n=1 Tax=Schistosoma margrebowiei TaxID=48269 RepID=A0AA85AMA0_9TREM|nr:unnamed protein product [Schistosoma margrebowiei]